MNSPTHLSGGLFNQVWALQGLVFMAYDSKQPLSLPFWHSHLAPSSMGLEKDPRFKQPIPLPFAALWRVDAFVAALRKHGVRTVESTSAPEKPAQTSAQKAVSSNVAMRRYLKYLKRRANGTEAAHPLEDVVYRALVPAPHLSLHVRRLRQEIEAVARGGSYGCLHARVERDIQRWWYHLAKVRPPTLAQILAALGAEADLNRSTAIYVCVGSDLKPRDQETLKRGGTAWGAALLRRSTLPSEAWRKGAVQTPTAGLAPGSGIVRSKLSSRDASLWSEWLHDLLHAQRLQLNSSAGSAAGGGGSLGRARSYRHDQDRRDERPPPRTVPMTYIEEAIIDQSLCRAASWFAGWSSSSFSASLAYLRHLDRRQGAYSYCAPGSPFARPQPSRGGVLGANGNAYATSLPAARLQFEHAKRLLLHTCKTANHSHR